MKIKDLFASDVTRDIAPVVYFHEQSPEKLQSEVSEYIVTGGFPEEHPNHKRVPDGIHEQYVHLLRAILEELGRSGGPDLPASWISGFYGSGKSSFAKLLGLALDGVELPDGKSMAEALLARDSSPKASEFRDAWGELRKQIDPIAVVFDIGGLARDDEHIHSVCVRQVQTRLGYCSTQPLVAEFELGLERDGRWSEFEEKAHEVLGQPWTQIKDMALAEEDFSAVMHGLDPDKYTDPMSWFLSRAGTSTQTSAAADATRAVADMLEFRAKGKTLFMVVDEVSQYIHQDQQRMLKLQSFVSELGQRLKGKAWLLVTGQQKLEEADDSHVLSKLKDRFKPKLRVHLAATNIRDVVHKRLLQKTPEADALLRVRFREHRNDLKLFAYGCEDISEEDFVEVYPLLPGHIDLLLQITTALRVRSTRSQGDDQAIRGLLQLLGELFRGQNLAEMLAGRLVTLDQIYEVQHTALDSDVQNTLVRVLDYCAKNELPLAARAAKAVALLELVQDTIPTDANFVARCLFDQLDCGKQDEKITEALEELRRANLLAYSEKQGYKIQSSSGEEWENERRNHPISRDALVGYIQEALKYLLSGPARPTIDGRAFPWMAYFSDSHRADNVLLQDARDPANVTLDFRLLSRGDRDPAQWVNRSSDDKTLRNRVIWVAEDASDLESQAREYGRSLAMVGKYRPRRESLPNDKKYLLLQEEARSEELERRLRTAVDAAWMGGNLYFRGSSTQASELGSTFGAALAMAGNQFLRPLYPNFLALQISPTELMQLLEPSLNAPSPKYLEGDLGILSLDAGKYVASCEGVAPLRVMQFIEQEHGVGGELLLKHFGGPPYGYTSGVVHACVAGLLRAGRVRIEAEGGQILTAQRDAGARDVFEKERGFRRASFFPAEEGTIGAKDINRICQFFDSKLNDKLDRSQSDIADAVSHHFPARLQRLRDVLGRLNQLPSQVGEHRPIPHALAKLEGAIEACLHVVRQTQPTLLAVKRNLDALNDGFEQLAMYDLELTDTVLHAVRQAENVTYQLDQLEELGESNGELEAAADKIRRQLGAEKPWRDLAAIEPELETVRTLYVEARRRLLVKSGELEEAARGQIKGREGFATLTADQSHHVLRPIAEALPTTTEEAVSPKLVDLRDGAHIALARAEEQANENLDKILSEGDEPQVRKVAIRLRNREIKSQADLEAVIDEIRRRVEPELLEGRRVRLVD